MSKLAAFLAAATQAGISRIDDPNSEPSLAPTLQREALVSAAPDAQADAQTLAQALGERLALDRVITTVETAQLVLLAPTRTAQPSNETSGLEEGLNRY
ncbi:hypothetical protein MPNT_50184 [Candidatus Methylacidithermus pantelleriae]|uniref:Uncharacterized protein n=1 Tax=Candidatus Methylacidithermus pantelleriae TaxID=2744239 RepID=A0A8J2BQ74_9BACT|nr:hypothetical protein MPNT_50184 [Candidatus Methylacidithermus pantelleriae]